MLLKLLAIPTSCLDLLKLNKKHLQENKLDENACNLQLKSSEITEVVDLVLSLDERVF
jgi:hypothetical protein